MNTYNLVDFDDILTETVNGLLMYPEAVQYFRRKYRYWSIDEAQDNSLLQNRLLGLLIGPEGNLFMVGDDDQSIYNFRGAQPEFLLSYERCDAVKSMVMSTNFRSGTRIVNSTAELIKNNRIRKDKQMIPANEIAGEINVYPGVHTLEMQHMFILNAAREAVADGSSLAILSRLNSSALPLVFLFEKNGIPFDYAGVSDSAFDNPVFRALIRVADYAADRTSLEKYKNARTALGIYYAKETEELLEKECTDLPGRDVLTVLIKIRQDLKKDYDAVEKAKDFLELKAGTTPYGFALRYVYSGIGVKVNTQSIGELSHLCTALSVFAMCPLLNEPADLYGKIRKKMEKCKEERSTGEFQTPGNVISVGSIHSSKGLEYDRVILTDCFSKVMDEIRLPEPGEFAFIDPEEELRLFYVGCTRAKSRLDILMAHRYHGYPIAHTDYIDLLYKACCKTYDDRVFCDFTETEGYNGIPVEITKEYNVKNVYYAVKFGRKPGIYRNWADCEANVKGYRKAQYKKFDNIEDAQAYLNTENGGKQPVRNSVTKSAEPDRTEENFIVKSYSVNDGDNTSEDCDYRDEFPDGPEGDASYENWLDDLND